jgi:tRNA modification GTPase
MVYDPLNGDTIAAVATPIGQAGIGIIRLSGPLSEKISRTIFRPAKPAASLESHRLYLGNVVDPVSGQVIDEVLLSFMKAPSTYTREDVVEINSHSGYLLLQEILELVLHEGARLAQPGEFTFRAFINGRVDLTQAEAIVDLINSKSERGVLLASRQIKGAFREEIGKLRQTVLDLLAQVEVEIDFPDEEEGIFAGEASETSITNGLIEPIEKLIANHDQRKMWIEGIATVIVGRVNAGKSSLLNRLLNEERAIVTPIPGTTRDIIESTIHVKGLPLRIMDTAGFRKGRGKLERLGMELTEKKMGEADLILLIIDQSRALSRDDLDLLVRIRNKKALVVLNKMDLPSKANLDSLKKQLDGFTSPVKISALTGEGIEDLQQAIRDQIMAGGAGDAATNIVPNLRHTLALSAASESFKKALQNLRTGLPLEIIAADLTSGLEALGEITGEHSSEELLDTIFSRFCIGK